MSQQRKKIENAPSLRHEVDALIQGISAVLKKKPKTVIKVLELWTNDTKPKEKSEPKKKAS